MKKLFTLVAVLFSIASFAADKPGPRDSKISISNNDRSNIQVKIDGRSYNLNNTFVMDNVKSGNHRITIYKTEQSGFRKSTKVIYNSDLFISAAQLVDIDINRLGRVQVKQTSLGRNDWGKGNGRNDDRGRDNNYGRH